MQQPDLYKIGTQVGRLEEKQKRTDARLSAIEETHETARRYLVRGMLLALLWSGVIGAGLSRDELASLMGAAIRKALSIG
jgi:hypothetical protein